MTAAAAALGEVPHVSEDRPLREAEDGPRILNAATALTSTLAAAGSIGDLKTGSRR